MKTHLPVQGVGVLVFDAARILLIRRKNPPYAGQWSIPGGQIKQGEKEEQAARRELFEETGIKAGTLEKVTTIRAQIEGRDYVLHDYLALSWQGVPKAGDDALKAQFFPLDQITSLAMWEEAKKIVLQGHRIYLRKNVTHQRE